MLALAPQPNQPTDPDPVAIGTLIVGIIGLIAPLVHTFRSQPPAQTIVNVTVDPNARSSLSHLEGHVDAMNLQLNQLLRAIDRGSTNPEAQFHVAPLRVGKSALLLTGPEFDAYSGSISQLYVGASQISQWVNMILRLHPDVAARLGARLEIPLSEIADRLNKAMAEGGPVGPMVPELRTALNALATAIEAELSKKQN